MPTADLTVPLTNQARLADILQMWTQVLLQHDVAGAKFVMNMTII
jgi:hypothetical protein